MKLTKKPQPTTWSDAELAILRQHYVRTPLPTLAEMLGRTPAATNAKAKRMGLRLPDTKAQPLGTEKLQHGILRRKIAMSGPYQWRAVSLLEQSPEIQDLYRILSHIHKAARKTAE